MIRRTIFFAAAFAVLLSVPTQAHHNPVIYDGKQEVKISGVVKSARFGFPHSRYLIDVENRDGEIERWTVMAEDPGDAREMGFDDALKRIKAGDEMTIIGWPHRYKAREIRGYQLHFADGTAVTMRTGNYIWTADLLRIWHLRIGRVDFDPAIQVVNQELPAADRLIAFIEEDDTVSRIAFEINQESAQLFGLVRDGVVEFPGVEELMECHIDRDGFTTTIDLAAVSDEQRLKINAGQEYLSKFNGRLSLYWEQDIESC